MISACAAPASCVWPRPAIAPSTPTITQPTRGFGSERPTACAASARAAAIGVGTGGAEVAGMFSRATRSRLMRLGGRRAGAAFAAVDDEEVAAEQGGADVRLVARRRDVRIIVAVAADDRFCARYFGMGAAAWAAQPAARRRV